MLESQKKKSSEVQGLGVCAQTGLVQAHSGHHGAVACHRPLDSAPSEGECRARFVGRGIRCVDEPVGRALYHTRATGRVLAGPLPGVGGARGRARQVRVHGQHDAELGLSGVVVQYGDVLHGYNPVQVRILKIHGHCA